MTLNAGTKLGPYEILAPARRRRHGRGLPREGHAPRAATVAIKVLPEHLSAQPELRARFEREARTVSALNHPAHLRALRRRREKAIDFLVHGAARGRDARGPARARARCRSTEALRIGDRDRRRARRARTAPASSTATSSPATSCSRRRARSCSTSGSRSASGRREPGSRRDEHADAALQPSQPLTDEGTILGTFQYMAPEQLEGARPTRAATSSRFGCVLYEMIDRAERRSRARARRA